MKKYSRFRQRWQAFRTKTRAKQILAIGIVGIGALLAIALITTVYFAASLSSKESIMNRNDTGLTLLDRNGKVIYEFYNAHSGTYVALKDVSPLVQKAIIAAEDKDFYEHPGFSIAGIGRAVSQFGAGGGGSTLTQQLVKNALLSHDRNFLRKYQEMVLSIEIERRYSKEEILEMYLNSTYFGEGAFGIEDAAKAYFGKASKDLTLAEASMIAGLLPAPSAYSPVTGDPEKAKQRQNYVLNRMKEDGHITVEEAEAAKVQPLAYAPANANDDTRAHHFAIMVKDELEQKYGEELIARSGYKVKTTLDLDKQTKAEGIVGKHLTTLAANRASNASVVVIDPKTGELLALLGSRDWHNESFGKVNMATAARQPGSSFKPLVYATGIEEGTLTAASILHDKPTDFGNYKPTNYDGRFRGNVTVRRALATSLNVPAVEAMQKIGVGDVMEQAETMGISTLTESAAHYTLPLALGTGEVPLSELTSAYTAFANQGQQRELHTILTVTDKSGSEIFKAAPKTKQAISSATAYIISSILSDNNARAEVFGNSLTVNARRPVAVKTGTTNDYRDALTVGYTPGLTIGVWVGNNDNTPMSSVAGSRGAAPIWRQLMQDFLGNSPIEQFSQPAGVVAQAVCANGARAIKTGGNTYTEYFVAGKLPNEVCNADEPKKEDVKKDEEEEKPKKETPKETIPEEPEEETPNPNEEEGGSEGEEEPGGNEPPTQPSNPIQPITN